MPLPTIVCLRQATLLPDRQSTSWASPTETRSTRPVHTLRRTFMLPAKRSQTNLNTRFIVDLFYTVGSTNRRPAAARDLSLKSCDRRHAVIIFPEALSEWHSNAYSCRLISSDGDTRFFSLIARCHHFQIRLSRYLLASRQCFATPWHLLAHTRKFPLI